MPQFLTGNFCCHPHAGLVLLSNLNSLIPLSFDGLLKIRIQPLLKVILYIIPLNAPTTVHLSHVETDHARGAQKCSGR